jgi:hypothetical protein
MPLFSSASFIMSSSGAGFEKYVGTSQSGMFSGLLSEGVPEGGSEL